MDERIDTARLRKAAQVVFLVTDEPATQDLSTMLEGAADEIDNLRAERDRLEKALETIASGMGGIILGTVSLSREEMHSIASNALTD